MGTREGDVPTHGGVAPMKASIEDRIVRRAAALLVDRLLADESGVPDAKPLVDGDGDLICECGRVFVTAAAMRQHVTKSHGGQR